MTEHGEGEERQRRSVGAELIIPVGALLFTLYYFWTIADVPWVAQVSAVFVGTILIVLIGVFCAKTALAVRRGEADLGMGALTRPREFVTTRLVLLALTVGFIIFIRWGGFTLTSFVFLAAAMLLLGRGRRPWLILCLSAVFAAGGWLLFVVAFETRFPEGPFEWLMAGFV